jgi:hypothetical protein
MTLPPEANSTDIQLQISNLQKIKESFLKEGTIAMFLHTIGKSLAKTGR